ncbi:hypothetical protein RFI_16070, partial [Reticulomyxa filosa]
SLIFKAKLERVGNEKEVKICEEGMLMQYKVEKDAELNIVVHARAPALCGKYTACWRLVGEDKNEIGPRLDMILVVKSDLSEDKEKAIRTMMVELGFTDRGAVVAVLSANRWNVAAAAQQLIDEASTRSNNHFVSSLEEKIKNKKKSICIYKLLFDKRKNHCVNSNATKFLKSDCVSTKKLVDMSHCDTRNISKFDSIENSVIDYFFDTFRISSLFINPCF